VVGCVDRRLVLAEIPFWKPEVMAKKANLNITSQYCDIFFVNIDFI